MNKEQVDKLIFEGKIPDRLGQIELIETHISWVVLGEQYAYKIKKPVQYSFLDFSSLERRKYYCEREIELNKRLTEGIYLDVQPVRDLAGHYSIGYETGGVIDYAVRMLKMDRKKQMDFLLLNKQVSPEDLQNLAVKIASFHRKAEIISHKDLQDIQIKFNDLGKEIGFLKKVDKDNGKIIEHAIKKSDEFNRKNKSLLEERLKSGFIRDCHGDLHSRNIFFLPGPQPFDCIEFNDDYRQIDVLNEVAFLCMDLDYFGRDDLSDLFISYYNQLFPAMNTEKDHQLFIYFKSYRANIRAKINSLRAQSSMNSSDKSRWLAETVKYLNLMNRYLGMLRDQ
jgi:aminoglycoside phosphotransferase family enzyme